MQHNAIADSIFLPHHEKRKDPRKRASWKVSGKFKCGKTIEAYTLDVSKSGLSMAMDRPTPIGSKAHIKIDALIGGKTRKIEAVIEVVHEVLSQNVFKCGVKFLLIDELGKKLLSSYAS